MRSCFILVHLTSFNFLLKIKKFELEKQTTPMRLLNSVDAKHPSLILRPFLNLHYRELGNEEPGDATD